MFVFPRYISTNPGAQADRSFLKGITGPVSILTSNIVQSTRLLYSRISSGYPSGRVFLISASTVATNVSRHSPRVTVIITRSSAVRNFYLNRKTEPTVNPSFETLSLGLGNELDFCRIKQVLNDARAYRTRIYKLSIEVTIFCSYTRFIRRVNLTHTGFVKHFFMNVYVEFD